MDIRPGEWHRSLLGFFMLLLVVGAITVVKSVRDAVFLSRFSVTQLSFIAIGLAVATSFIVSLYLRYTQGIPRHRLIAGTNGVVVASMVAIFVGLQFSATANVLPWVLYIVSSIFGVFLVMQFWLLAGDLFDPREAKRLFGFVGAGAILGGIVGGVLSRELAAVIGSSALLLVAAAMLVVEAVLAWIVWPLRGQDSTTKGVQETEKEEKGGLSSLIEHRYLGLLALAVLLATVATTLLDWQFKGVVKAEFAGRTDAMASYFGTLYAYLSAASFLLQTLFTGWILRRYGVRVGLLLLPTSVLLGSGAIAGFFLIPGLTRLLAASGAKVAEGGLRFAIDKASMELMWMPVPGRVKEQGKAFVDTVMDRFGTGISGVVWLILASFGLASPDKIHLISFAVIAFTVPWFVVVLRARRAYVDAFRQVLARRELKLDAFSTNLMDAEARGTVIRTLESDDPREREFALYLLEQGWSGPLPDLGRLLTGDQPALALRALALLRDHRDADQRQAALSCLVVGSAEVRRAAINYLRQTAPRGRDELLEEGIEGLDQSTVDIIWLGLEEHRSAALDRLRKRLTKVGSDRLSLIRQLGAAPVGIAGTLLAPLLSDADPAVVRAAMDSAGACADPSLVPSLMEQLSQRRFRGAAMAALRELGPNAISQLEQALMDRHPPESHAAMLRVLGASAAPAAAGPLLAAAARGPELRTTALRALVRLHRTCNVAVDTTTINRMLEDEIQAIYRKALALGRGSWAVLRSRPRPDDLLERAVWEHLDERMDRVFRLLALRHGVSDIRSAVRGLRSPAKSIRASAIEFLDNLLPAEERTRLLALWEDTSALRLAQLARREYALLPEARDALLRRLLGHRVGLLRAVAATVAAAEERKELVGALDPALAQEGWVEQVVRHARMRIAADEEGDSMALTVIDKALKLQTVDVLQRASTEDLAYVAQIAQEVELPADATLYSEGDAPDALFVILSGKVRLHLDGEEIASLGSGEAFGSWALVDESPRVTSATTMEPTMMLKVEREEFTELLADRVNIVQAVFKAMVERVRVLTRLAQS